MGNDAFFSSYCFIKPVQQQKPPHTSKHYNLLRHTEVSARNPSIFPIFFLTLKNRGVTMGYKISSSTNIEKNSVRYDIVAMQPVEYIGSFNSKKA